MVGDNQDHAFDVPKRDRGILSHADREYLWGAKDLSGQSERDARYRIRNRVRNGILDYRILNTELSEDDRQQIFEKIQLDDQVDLFEFHYKGIHDGGNDFETTDRIFEMLIERAINNALLELDPDHVVQDVSIEVDIDRTSPELDELIEKFEMGEESIAELRYLLHHTEIGEEVEPSEIVPRIVDEGEIEEGEDGSVNILFEDYTKADAFFEAMDLERDNPVDE